MELSKKERLILYNQYEILKSLNPEEAEIYEVDQEILINGFRQNYNDLVDGFMEETPEEVSQFVIDVLQMYRSLNISYKELGKEDKKKIDLYDISFKGFDGNEETDYYMYADFYINKLGRFEELKESEHFDTNYHASTIEHYKKMLDLWKEVKEGRYDQLTLSNMLYILEK